VSDVQPTRGVGRPPAAAAGRVEAEILDHATAAFLRDGYAASSIESIARQAHVAKRTLYARWADKAALFRAVLERLMTRWIAADTPDTAGEAERGDAERGDAGLQPTLMLMAERILAVALTPEALALHRVMIAESARFPELGALLHGTAAEAGVARIAAVLDKFMAAGSLASLDSRFAAEQFLHLVLRGPQIRALGLAPAFDAAALRRWMESSVALFLNGCRVHGTSGKPD
jgi:AcrR family transcriptional regulator